MNDQEQLQLIKTEFEERLKYGLLNLHIKWLIEQAEKLQSLQPAIPWQKYDPTDRRIESHVDHIVTNGQKTLIAQHAAIPGTGKYSWMINKSLISWVTHWAPINLPGEE